MLFSMIRIMLFTILGAVLLHAGLRPDDYSFIAVFACAICISVVSYLDDDDNDI